MTTSRRFSWGMITLGAFAMAACDDRADESGATVEPDPVVVGCDASELCIANMDCRCPQCFIELDDQCGCVDDETCTVDEPCYCNDCGGAPLCEYPGALGDYCPGDTDSAPGPHFCKHVYATLGEVYGKNTLTTCHDQQCAFECTDTQVETCTAMGGHCDVKYTSSSWFCVPGVDPGPPYGDAHLAWSDCYPSSTPKPCESICADLGRACETVEFMNHCFNSPTSEPSYPGVERCKATISSYFEDKPFARCVCAEPL